MKLLSVPLIGLTVAVLCIGAADGSEEILPVSPRQIIASLQTTDVQELENTLGQLRTQRDQLCASLSAILQNRKASNSGKCAAAYYLGELHLTNGVHALAANITLKFDTSHVLVKHLIRIDLAGYTAADALTKIGFPAIPILIQTLAQSDDEAARELSLKTLCRIDDDKEIVELRLKKAVNAQTDFQRKQRLQAALKHLPAIEI